MDVNNLVNKLNNEYLENFEEEYINLYTDYKNYAEDIYLPVINNNSISSFLNFLSNYSLHREKYVEGEVNKYLEEYNQQLKDNEYLENQDNYDDFNY